VEVGGAHTTVVRGSKMFCEIVSEVISSTAPVYVELPPVEPHIDRLRATLLDFVVYDTTLVPVNS
jgi:hypothetical protein